MSARILLVCVPLLGACAHDARESAPTPPDAVEPAAQADAASGQQARVFGETSVREGLDKEDIRFTIRANIGDIRTCYESAVSARGDLSGKVSVRWTISADGTVADAGVAKDSIGDERLTACILDAIRRWVFPPPKRGGIVHVTYPFVFKRQPG